MITIRRQVFETNSSSQHSIVVLKDDHEFDTFQDFIDQLDENNRYVIKDVDDLHFCRHPFRILATFKNKLNCVLAYYIAFAKEGKNDETTKEIEDIIRKYYPNFGGIVFPTYKYSCFYDKETGEIVSRCSVIDRNEVKDVYHYKDGISIKECVYKVEQETSYGYVEECDNLIKHFLKKYDVTLEDFLFNSKYVVIIDGDEYCWWQLMQKDGAVDLENIESEYPEYTYFDAFAYCNEEDIDLTEWYPEKIKRKKNTSKEVKDW